ncbi:MAG: NFACT RNA binding domain-containing protein [Balneolaceae bacterium]|nr:NFACT RNA binding domain-containing protein [Balneolaceae bacterium]
MNNFYELIYLKKDLKEKIVGGQFDLAITPHKDVIECYIDTAGQTCRLVFSANPNEIALFLDKYRPPKKSNVLEFFDQLKGVTVDNVSLAEKDRLLYIHFEDGHTLLFKLYGVNPNALLIHHNEVIGAFKDTGEVTGKPPPEPDPPAFAEEVNPEAKPKNQIVRLNPLLPRNLIPYLVDQHEVESMEPEEVKAFVDQLTGELLDEPHPRVLVTGETCLWSEETLSLETEKQFDTVNDCIRYAYRETVHERRLSDRKQEAQRVLDRVINKYQSQLEELEQADRSLDRADKYEKFGHLLMAHAHEQTDPGKEEIEVQDLYNEEETVTIPLKDQKDLAENARYYYEKAKDSRKSFEKALERGEETEKLLNTAQELRTELAEIEGLREFDKWEKKRQDQLNRFGYGTGGSKQATSPFRKIQLGKYEVWIGKSAKSNDELVRTAHKEDVWLHARGVSGSHVVIRMGNRKEQPPQDILLKAASFAAYYSKARGMKSVPVIYTRVKYIRKPKGADPGSVVVEREQVEMVPPMNPEQLKTDD